ncbi:hypothetical protein VTJ83DRAFT_2747 [Remersonia thermophila]|uniref:SHSP domain-containing protein n=1 Tax=Remersonia thermophila TaxID=72144 RepID=A0ABR4DJL3_9PEZI
MMSFFPGSFCAPAQELSYAPLFRLLEDFDSYSREAQAQPRAQTACPAASCAAPTNNRRKRTRQPRPQPTFRPSFDVRETETAYELYGELPGLAPENVTIEFTEPQTMVISGRVERHYPSAVPALPANEADEANEANEAAAAGSDSASSVGSDDEFTSVEKPRRSSYQATVEDDPEEPAEPTPATSPAASPKVAPADVAMTSPEPEPEPEPQAREVAPAKAERPAAPEARVLLSERAVGEFSRAFTFPARVDYDGVTASLNNGILRVEVPKARPMVRRIEIGF